MYIMVITMLLLCFNSYYGYYAVSCEEYKINIVILAYIQRM